MIYGIAFIESIVPLISEQYFLDLRRHMPLFLAFEP